MATEASVNDTHNTNLYYEGHITLEPFEVGNYGYLEASMEAACAMFDMRLSTFAMFKDEQAEPDAFVSLRSDTYVDMCDRIGAAQDRWDDSSHVTLEVTYRRFETDAETQERISKEMKAAIDLKEAAAQRIKKLQEEIEKLSKIAN